MKKEIRRNLYQTTSPTYAYNSGSVYNNTGSTPTITETCMGVNLFDVNRFKIPSMRPYGFISMPTVNVRQVIGYLGANSGNPFVMGHMDVFNNKPYTIVPGDSGIYSQNYALIMSTEGSMYYYLGADHTQYTATPISGEDVNQIFIDILTYLAGGIQDFMSNLVDVYNSHTHPLGGIPDPQLPPIPSYPSQLTLDLTSVQNGLTLINSDGQTPLPS